jgi:hypothetical protein
VKGIESFIGDSKFMVGRAEDLAEGIRMTFFSRLFAERRGE